MALLTVCFYIAAQMLSDIASLKVGVVFGLAVDMGTFIYPITFTLRDMIHKVWGKNAARSIILAAGLINLLMMLYLSWVAQVPSDISWGLGHEFKAILSPLWRLVLASIVAEVVSELLDTEVYHWFVTKVTTRFQWLRVLISNSVSVPVDNIIFSLGAFAPIPFLGLAGLSWQSVGEIFIFNLSLKYAITLFSLPLIYLVKEKSHQS